MSGDARLVAALIAVAGIYMIGNGIARTVSVLWAYVASAGFRAEFDPSLLFLTSFQSGGVVVGLALVLLRNRLAQWLAPVGEAGQEQASELSESLLVVAGVSIAAFAVVQGAALVASEVAMAPVVQGPWPERVGIAVQAAVGVGIALGSRGIAGGIRKLRNAR